MKRMFCIFIAAMVTPLLGGCFGKGTSADPPANFMATEGDGRVILTWDPVPNVDFWIFTATDPNLTAFNWTGLPNAHAYINAATPFYMCGLLNGTQYYFAANGRTNGGPGGTSSPTITTASPPYNASARPWTTGSTPTASDLYGVGYTGLTTCSNNTTSAAGSFAAVGAGGAIFTSSDGKTWAAPTTPPPGFSSDLYAVTGYAANQNNPTTPNLRWVAVGDGGTAVYSTDGSTWSVGTSTTTTQPLRSITQVTGNFFAVGNTGTIISSTDGNTWSSHTSTSGTTNNLNGVTHGGIFVAVGDNGTIVISSDGNTWSVKTPAPSIPTINLRQVTSFISSYGSIYVAVGDAGTVVTSKDGGTTWITQTAISATNLVGVTAESRAVDTTTTLPIDLSLGFVSTAQFVAVDSTGQTYTSVNGYTWAPSVSTGISCSTTTFCVNPLVSSGFGYVAVGNAGATAYAF